MTGWLPTLKTKTPRDGYDLAVKLARDVVTMTQPDAYVRERLRPVCAEDADALIASSQVVPTHFATVAAAYVCWRVLDGHDRAERERIRRTRGPACRSVRADRGGGPPGHANQPDHVADRNRHG